MNPYTNAYSQSYQPFTGFADDINKSINRTFDMENSASRPLRGFKLNKNLNRSREEIDPYSPQNLPYKMFPESTKSDTRISKADRSKAAFTKSIERIINLNFNIHKFESPNFEAKNRENLALRARLELNLKLNEKLKKNSQLNSNLKHRNLRYSSLYVQPESSVKSSSEFDSRNSAIHFAPSYPKTSINESNEFSKIVRNLRHNVK